MAAKKGFMKSRAGKVTMNFIYGAAAAVVIVGALFKILHWPGANEMLIIGMFTEAFVFLISAFDPPADDYEWERVYPVLAEKNFIPEETEALTRFEPRDMPQLNPQVFDAVLSLMHEGSLTVLGLCILQVDHETLEIL